MLVSVFTAIAAFEQQRLQSFGMGAGALDCDDICTQKEIVNVELGINKNCFLQY